MTIKLSYWQDKKVHMTHRENNKSHKDYKVSILLRSLRDINTSHRGEDKSHKLAYYILYTLNVTTYVSMQIDMFWTFYLPL